MYKQVILWVFNTQDADVSSLSVIFLFLFSNCVFAPPAGCLCHVTLSSILSFLTPKLCWNTKADFSFLSRSD